MSSHNLLTPKVIEQMAIAMAETGGLDFHQKCGFETGADDCTSDTCVALHYEDHDPDAARRNLLANARAAFSVAEASERDSERCDVLAYLRGRLRMANTVADNNPGEMDRAIGVMRSVTIEIEAIEQGLHEGAAELAQRLGGGNGNG